MTKNFILVCDSAISNNKLDVLGVFDSIYATGFPAIHQRMSIVVNLEVESTEQNQSHVESFRILYGGEEITTLETSFTPTKSRHQFIHNIQNVSLPNEGKYTVEISINGSPIGETYFLVSSN